MINTHCKNKVYDVYFIGNHIIDFSKFMPVFDSRLLVTKSEWLDMFRTVMATIPYHWHPIHRPSPALLANWNQLPLRFLRSWLIIVLNQLVDYDVEYLSHCKLSVGGFCQYDCDFVDFL